MRSILFLACRVAVTLALSACHAASGPEIADSSTTESRYQLDSRILAWCTQRKGLPGTFAGCSCLADQLHVQRLPDDGARDLVHVLYAVGPGSDPPLTRLPVEHRERLSRAAELCGTPVP